VKWTSYNGRSSLWSHSRFVVVVIAVTAERLCFVLLSRSDVNFHRNNYPPCSKFKQCQAFFNTWRTQHFELPERDLCLFIHWLSFFMVSKGIWCQFLVQDKFMAAQVNQTCLNVSHWKKVEGQRQTQIKLTLWQHCTIIICEVWNKLQCFWGLKAIWISSPE
jgi:hypothetical protein